MHFPILSLSLSSFNCYIIKQAQGLLLLPVEFSFNIYLEFKYFVKTFEREREREKNAISATIFSMSFSNSKITNVKLELFYCWFYCCCCFLLTSKVIYFANISLARNTRTHTHTHTYTQLHYFWSSIVLVAHSFKCIIIDRKARWI